MEKLYRFPKPCMVCRNAQIMSALAAAIREEDGNVVDKIMDNQLAAYVSAGTEAKIFASLKESGMLLVEIHGLTGKWIVHPSTIEPAVEQGDDDDAGHDS